MLQPLVPSAPALPGPNLHCSGGACFTSDVDDVED